MRNYTRDRVLTLLSLNMNIGVPHSMIDAAIWPEAPGLVTRANRLRVILDLRKNLPPGYQVLNIHGDGYVMERLGDSSQSGC